MKTYLIKDNKKCWSEWRLGEEQGIDDLLISYMDFYSCVKKELLAMILKYVPLEESFDVVNALIEDDDYKIRKIVELSGVVYSNDES